MGVERWSRFLVARTDEAYETLAKEDDDMADAERSLEEISSDPDVRALDHDAPAPHEQACTGRRVSRCRCDATHVKRDAT